ncbi:hypothetical protein F8M41_001906 [Gigaspora margarita]|uniref:Uncharacterized protein n=1 Tax=Gigaspora margarita TaxID=4874 RepID=A0A8H3XG49_GIGMA|nr:hypothetical protein F8M41_001906 [Gigaspora margarita]
MFSNILESVNQENKLHIVIVKSIVYLTMNFRNAWSKLYHLKKRYPTIPILAMTITLAYEDIILLYNRLQFNSENVVTI